MSLTLKFDEVTGRLLHAAVIHEIERMEARLQAIDEESDEAVYLANDLTCLEIVREQLKAIV